MPLTVMITKYFNLFLLIITLIAFSGSLEARECSVQPLPEIEIEKKSNRINYDFSLSKIALQNFNIDTLSPYNKDAHIEIGGLMNGEISINTSVSFGWSTENSTRKSCFWFEKIMIKIHIDPTIYVAKEHPQGTCMHDSILDHEMKHIETDREIIKKFASLIDMDVRKITARVGTVGPVGQSAAEKTRKKMLDVIEKTVSKRADMMYLERRKKQQAIDSLEEYERVASSCN